MAKTTQHVVPSSKGGWSVKKGGAEKSTKNFPTKDKAVDFAKDVAKIRVQNWLFMGKMGRSRIQTHMDMIHVPRRIRSKKVSL
jgi:hypothetical protein